MPGKLQKQTTQVVRNTPDPLFEHELMFEDLSYEEALRMRLRMKVGEQGGSKGSREGRLWEQGSREQTAQVVKKHPKLSMGSCLSICHTRRHSE